ncbi:hypothetical protein EI94DRAFT_1560010, partial [Lactarius quietus]
PYVLSSAIDPVLGVFTGALAYYLYETNPRTAPPPEQKLDSLVRWKVEKYRSTRAERDSEGTSSDVDWSKLLAQTRDK